MNDNHTLVEPAPLTLAQKCIAWTTGFLVLAFFFRYQILSNFSVTAGDRYDGTIAAALLEHWFNALRGLADWRSLNYFFPYPKTLAYNEGFFLYGLIYSAFRWVSLDPFLSGELVIIAFKSIGFAGFFWASRRMLGLSFAWSLLGATLFSISNNGYAHGFHVQLFSIALVPVEAWLVYESCLALISSQRRRLLAFGSLAALLFSAWLLTCLYTAWFFALFLSITVIAQMLLGGKPVLHEMRRACYENAGTLAVIAVIGVLSLLPFVSVYMGGRQIAHDRTWGDLLLYSPSLFDTINVGTNNLLFGDVLARLRSLCRVCDLGEGERDFGIAPLLFALAVASIIVIAYRKQANHGQGRLLLGGMAIACAVTWLLAIRIGTFSGWYLIYKFWPGGRGLRVIPRLFLFLSAPVVGLAMCYLSNATRHWRAVFVALFCAVLLLEEVNVFSFARIDRGDAMRRIAAVPSPPAACRAFFTTASPDTVDDDPAFVVGALYPHNVDAMFIAEYVNLPTINGFASFNPPDWNFGHPTRADYLARVASYARSHGLVGLCQLDLKAMRWSLLPEEQ